MLKVIVNPLREDPKDNERCSICYISTKYWYDLKDVALCKKCAKTTLKSDVPAKKQWFENCKNLRKSK